jgi:hypothetical protein
MTMHDRVKQMMLDGLTLPEMTDKLHDTKELGIKYTPQWMSTKVKEVCLMANNEEALREYWAYRKAVRRVHRFKTKLVEQVINKEIEL